MKFKTIVDGNSLFYVGIIVLFPAFISHRAFTSELPIFGFLFAGLAVAAAVCIVLDFALSAYVFEDDKIVYKAIFGGEKIPYDKIVEAHTRRAADGRLHLYLSIGRRHPHKVKVKDTEAFFAELLRQKPDVSIDDEQ
ncbi:MAG: hypothetical protein FWB74_08460 [Defluviitaleaceae bacterium]|nr:hypothetical protein [Defluviitaleaceae bacterium]